MTHSLTISQNTRKVPLFVLGLPNIILPIDCTELGPTKGACESDEKECFVPAIYAGVSEIRHHGKDVVSDCRGNLVLGPTVFPSDPSHGHLDECGGGRRS
jgi:hypothetical protein